MDKNNSNKSRTDMLAAGRKKEILMRKKQIKAEARRDAESEPALASKEISGDETSKEMAQAMASMAGVLGSSQAVLEGDEAAEMIARYIKRL